MNLDAGICYLRQEKGAGHTLRKAGRRRRVTFLKPGYDVPRPFGHERLQWDANVPGGNR